MYYPDPTPIETLRISELGGDRILQGIWLSGHISVRGCKKKPRLRASREELGKMLLVELALQGFLHFTVTLTKVYLLPTTALEKSDGSPKATPCLEQDLELAKDWLIAPHLASSSTKHQAPSAQA